MPETKASASRPLAVPRTRLSRMARLGGMASGVAGSMAVEGLRRYGKGDRPAMRDLLLTPGNVERVTAELARMRGAAMKLGQLVSMDTGDVLSPELASILARLRADADHMPPRQLRRVLDANWGADWLRRFKRFDTRPIAAASIGQVHRAVTRDGRDLAIKVQYPGVRDSIDADVTNVGALIKVSGLLPQGLDMAPLLDEAKTQLRDEADYGREAEALNRYRSAMGAEAGFLIPEVALDLSSRDILAMTFVDGVPIEEAAEAPQETRDRLMKRLLTLTLREVFDFGLSQTDPNFANYRYQPDSDRVVLLDFGAVRAVSPELVETYRDLLRAGLDGDSAEMRAAAVRMGFFPDDVAPHHERLIMEMMEIAFGALRADAPFDFTDTGPSRRIQALGMELGEDRGFHHVPPVDTLFLQRKFAGMFLLAARLDARVNVRRLLEQFL